MPKIYVSEEVEGGYYASTPLLLGAVAYEKGEAEAIAAAIRRAEEQAAIYRELNLPLPVDYPPREWSIKKISDMTVEEDYAPLDDETLRIGLTLLDYLRKRLLNVVERFTDDALEWKIPGAGQLKNATQVLDHIAHADMWYISRLKDWPREPIARLQQNRSAIIDYVSALDANGLNLKTFNYLEEWTPRKVLRMVLEPIPQQQYFLQGVLEYQKTTGAELPTAPTECPCVSLWRSDADATLKVYLRYIDWRKKYYVTIPVFPGLALEVEQRDEISNRIWSVLQLGFEYLQKGEKVPELQKMEMQFVETDTNFFPEDEFPLAATELPEYFKAIARATELHTRFLKQLPKQIWEWKTAEGKSLQTLALNWANLEWWCLRCLQPLPREPIARLRASREWVVDRYKNLTPEERQRVTLHIGEEWTARKALRRAIEHEREHTWHLEEILEQYKNAIAKN